MVLNFKCYLCSPLIRIGVSWSNLTNAHIFSDGLVQPPTRKDVFHFRFSWDRGLSNSSCYCRNVFLGPAWELFGRRKGKSSMDFFQNVKDIFWNQNSFQDIYNTHSNPPIIPKDFQFSSNFPMDLSCFPLILSTPRWCCASFVAGF